MTNLMDPLDDAQRRVLDIVWGLFARHQTFPMYHYVERQLRKVGLDAAQVLDSYPSIGVTGYRGRYRAIFKTDNLPDLGSRVGLTMAGLYHIVDRDLAMQIIGALLAFMRVLSDERGRIIDEHPFDNPEYAVTLDAALKRENIDEKILPWAKAIAEHEWPGMHVKPAPHTGQIIGDLNLLADANFHTIEDYLNAITAATTPQQPTTIPEYRDPRALSRAITSFDVTCELVLKKKLVKKPAIDRTALFAIDTASYSDLQSGLSALGELLSELDVPKNKQSKQQHALGRLLSYLSQALPNIDQARVKDAIDLMDAVREIRNSGRHPRQSEKLIQAHDLLGLPFPLRDPVQAWDIIRAQMDSAFTMLQEEIYAAR